MKIPPSTPSVASGSAATTGESARAKGPSTTAVSGGSSDAVRLSPLSTQLQALASSLSSPEFDRAKVEQIKQALSQGAIAVRTDVVADRMIQEVKDRLGQGAK